MWYVWKFSLFTENWGVKLSSNFAKVGSHTHRHWSRPSQCERRPFGDKRRNVHAVGMNQDAYLGKSKRMQTKDTWIPAYISYFLMFLYSAVNKDSVTNIQVSQETLSNVQAEAWSSGHCGWISSAPSAELTPSRVLGHAAHTSYVWRVNSCNGPRQV